MMNSERQGVVRMQPSSAPVHATMNDQECTMTFSNLERNRASNDMATMDDFQFNASLDALLEYDGPTSAFVDNSAGNSGAGQTHTVSTAVSVASSSSSSTTTRGLQHQHSRFRPVMTAQPGSRHSGTQPSRPVPTGALMFPVPMTNDSVAEPSPLTGRLGYPMVVTTHSNSQKTNAPSARGRSFDAVASISMPPPSSPTPSRRRSPGPNMSGKRMRDDASAVSEDDDDKLKRRHDRNMREQQRSHLITEQISQLREVLASSNVHFKSDKYSTLVSVVDYIKELQSRSAMLDSEHKKLLDTIAKTNQMVNSQYYQTSADGLTSTLAVTNDLLSDGQTGNSALEDEGAVFVQGLDYKSVFSSCGVALAVTSIDGRFMNCNREFQTLSGYSREELLPGEASNKSEVMADVVPSADRIDGICNPLTVSTGPRRRNLSLFNLLIREDMEQIFVAMSGMLKNPFMSGANSQTSTVGTKHHEESRSPRQDYWSGLVTLGRQKDVKLRMNVTLVRSSLGSPKFFNCSLTPDET